MPNSWGLKLENSKEFCARFAVDNCIYERLRHKIPNYFAGVWAEAETTLQSKFIFQSKTTFLFCRKSLDTRAHIDRFADNNNKLL